MSTWAPSPSTLPCLHLPASPPRRLPTASLRRRGPTPPHHHAALTHPAHLLFPSQFKQTAEDQACPYNSNTPSFGLLSSTAVTTNVSLWRQQQRGATARRAAAAAAAATTGFAVAPRPTTGTAAAASADRRGAEGAGGEGGACQGLVVDERQAAWIFVVRGMFVWVCTFVRLCVV